jgi:hypothetical protein
MEAHLGMAERVAKIKHTYNTGDSLVVTDPTTNPALRSLTMGERTGPRILYELWSYVIDSEHLMVYETRLMVLIRGGLSFKESTL